MNIIFRLFILIVLISAAQAFAFADTPSSALDDKPSVDTAASSGLQIPAVASDASAAGSASTDTHPSYLYDLKKLIEKSRENIKEVNEIIKAQAVLKRNQKREERAREYYEKGMQLTTEGKLDEARDYFEKAVLITQHPEMAGYIRESQRRLARQENALQDQENQHNHQIKEDENTRKQDVEQAYKEAVELYKQKKYHPAKDAFQHVDEIAPDYRATSSYLKIIDQDIVKSDADAAKQQTIEIANQQKDAEAARAKEKAMWLQQIEEKEKERKEAVNKQAADVYDEAVLLYKHKKFAEAKKKFEEVSWVIPDYKDTMKYLGRIDRDAQEEQERDAQEQQKALAQQRWEEQVALAKKETVQRHELEIKERQHKKELLDQAQFLYMAAANLYQKRDMDGALEKFNDIEKLLPDYRATRVYMARIGQWKVQQQKKLMEEQIQQERQQERQKELDLEQKRTQELRQQSMGVSTISKPGSGPLAVVAGPEKASLKSSYWTLPAGNNESIEYQQKQAQDIASLAEKSAQLYSQIAAIADDSSTVQTKRKMAQVDEILNNLKENKERLIRKLQEEQGRLQEEENAKSKQEEELSAHENAEATHLRQLQENVESLHRSQKEKQEQQYLRQQQRVALQNLAQKASAINDDIIRLSRIQDYDAMKAKFTELENTVAALTTLKNEIDLKNNDQKREKQLGHEDVDHRVESIRKENYSKSGPSDVEQYKQKEMKQEQSMLFNEGVECYDHKQFPQAKLLFEELVQQHDRRADAWLKKVDRAISQEIVKGQEAQLKERTAFLADQLRAQRELVKIQERERQRQKELSEELEHQKRLFEDERSMQIRKEEAMKAQESERQAQEAKRLQMEKINEQEQEMYRFHKIGNTPNPPSATVAETPTFEVTTPSTDPKYQAQLEAQRAAVRKQLEDGVEAMYQEAVGYYKEGNYSAAVIRFKDVQDIIPGYKNTGEFLDKSLEGSQGSTNSYSAPSTSTIAPATPTAPALATRQDSVSKALDFFDPDAK